MAQRQRRDRHGGGVGREIARVPERGAQVLAGELPLARPAGGLASRALVSRVFAGRVLAGRVFVSGGTADVDAVEVPGEGEIETRFRNREVRRGQPVRCPVLEDGGRGKLADNLGVTAVRGPVGASREEGGADGGGVRDSRRGRVRAEDQADAVQRDGRGRPPGRRGEQRRAHDAGAGRIPVGGMDRQLVTVLLKIGVNTQPLQLAGGSFPCGSLHGHAVTIAAAYRDMTNDN